MREGEREKAITAGKLKNKLYLALRRELRCGTEEGEMWREASRDSRSCGGDGRSCTG
jgi:hypothetical protein